MRGLGVLLAGVVLAAGSLVAVGATPAGATTVTVSTEQAFRDAWTGVTPGVTQIDLGSNITFTGPCSGAAVRNSATALTVDGHGHTITLCTIAGDAVLQQSGVGALNFANVTITGATSTALGGALYSQGAVTVTGSAFTQNTSGLGGAILSLGDVTVTNSAFTNNTAIDGGAIASGAASGAVKATNTTFTNNTASSEGGAITIVGGDDVIVINSTFTTNTAGNGGAIKTGSGAVTTTGSTFTDNSASNGGAFLASGAVTVTDSTFTHNTSSGDVGAIRTVGAVTVTDSTFTKNSGGQIAGAIGANGAVTVTNSTFTDNATTLTTAQNAGAILSVASVTAAYSTFTGNTAAGASASAIVVRSTGTIQLFSSVLVKPVGAASLCMASTITSFGYNYANESPSPGSCNLNATGDSSLDTNDPMVGALASNGGPTQTQLPQTGSPLIDAIPSAACRTAPLATGITIDQRHLVRPEQTGGNCDIGAVEVQLPPVAVVGVPRLTG